VPRSELCLDLPRRSLSIIVDPNRLRISKTIPQPVSSYTLGFLFTRTSPSIRPIEKDLENHAIQILQVQDRRKALLWYLKMRGCGRGSKQMKCWAQFMPWS
jgi:hypothetical protein